MSKVRSTVAWGVIGSIVCFAMMPLEPSLLEEGLILEIAQRLVRGDRLYQDVVAFTGPLPFQGLALLFRVFGEEILVGRTAVALLQGGACASVFAIARSARRDGLEHVAAALMACGPIVLLPLLSIYFYTTLAVSIGTIATGVSLRGLDDRRWAFAGGVLVAACALCKQTIGVVLAGGLLVCLLLLAPRATRWRSIAAWVGGGVLVAAVTLAGFAATGGVGALVYSLVELPLSFQTTYESPMMNFWPPGVFSEDIIDHRVFYLPYFYSVFYDVWERPSWLFTLMTQGFYALPFLAIVATGLRRARGALPAAVWLHLVVVLAVGSNLFPRADWGHLLAALPAAAVQIVLVLPGLPASSETRRPFLAVPLGALAISSLGLGVAYYLISDPPKLGPRVPLRSLNPGLRGDSVPDAVRYLREHTSPGDPIFVARAEPLIYFATDTRNPTPYGGVIPGMAEEQQRVIGGILDDVRYVVMSDVDQPIFTWYSEELPQVQKALERFFRIPDDYLGHGLKWIQVLEHGPDRGPTHADLIDRLPEGRTWIRDRRGEVHPATTKVKRLATAQNRRMLPFLLGPRGGGIDFDVEIPEGAVFQASLGYPAASGAGRFLEHPPASLSILSIRTDGGFVPIGRKRIDLRRDRVRQWRPFEVDLSEYAGRRVTLRLEMRTDWLIRGFLVAWWGSPRVALRPPSEP